MIESDVYGMMDKTFSDIEQENEQFVGRKFKPLQERPLRPKEPDFGRILPKVSIDEGSYDTEEIEKHAPQNVVAVPEDVVHELVSRTDKRAADFTRLLLYRIAPDIMGFSASSNYVRAALKTLGIDSEVDNALAEGIRGVARLGAMFDSVQKARMPRVIKRRFMETLADRIANATADRFELLDKSQVRSRQIHELEAVVRKARDNNPPKESPLPMNEPRSTIGMSRRQRK